MIVRTTTRPIHLPDSLDTHWQQRNDMTTENAERDPRAELTLLMLGRTATDSAERIVAAGYTKPRQVTTVEELDALPVGSVVRMSGTNEDARVAVKDGLWRNESEWFVADAEEWCLDSSELDDLPATILYSPVVGA